MTPIHLTASDNHVLNQ